MRHALFQSLASTVVPMLAKAVEEGQCSLSMLRWLATPEGRKEVEGHLRSLQRTWIELQADKPLSPLGHAQAEAAWETLKKELVDNGVPSNGPELHPRHQNDPHGLRRYMIDAWTGASKQRCGYTVGGKYIDKVFPCLPSESGAFTGHFVGIRRASDGQEDLALMGIIQLRIEEALAELAEAENG